jgi:hypothetical protein
LRIVRVAGLGLLKTALLGLARLRFTVLLFVAVLRIGTLKFCVVAASLNVSVPVVVV